MLARVKIPDKNKAALCRNGQIAQAGTRKFEIQRRKFERTGAGYHGTYLEVPNQ
jgi:hypothetical protein